MSPSSRGPSSSEAIVAISEASACDLPFLTSIHVSAFENDNAVRLLFSGNQQAKAVMDMLQTQFNDPSYIIAVAKVQPDDGIVGWLGCSLLEYDGSNLGGKGKSEANDQDAILVENNAKSETKNGLSASDDPATTLVSLIHESSLKMKAKWVSGKCIYINTVVTEPADQRKGVATAMVEWITAKADRDKAVAFVQSSPAACQLYATSGFKDADHLDVELREFAPGGKEGHWGWGVYRFQYMLRMYTYRGKRGNETLR